MKTYIINETPTTFVLKEGNAGAFRKLGELKGKDDTKRSKFTIKVDPNATYRQYMVATGKKGKTIIINSDDFSEFEEIRIKKVNSEAGTAPAYMSVPTKPRKKNKSGGCPVADEDESSPAESSSGAVPAEPILVAAPATELGGSSSGVSLVAIESSPSGSSSGAVPPQPILVPVPSTELGGSSSGVSQAAIESSPAESSSGAVPAERILVAVPSTELGGSSSGVSPAAIESNPTGSPSNAGPNESIPGGSPNAGPGQAVAGVSSSTAAVEAPTGGSHLQTGSAAGGSNRVPWYKKLLKFVR